MKKFHLSDPFEGARRPYGYPEDVHFSRKYILEDQDKYMGGLVEEGDFTNLVVAQNGMGEIDQQAYKDKLVKFALMGSVFVGVMYFMLKKQRS